MLKKKELNPNSMTLEYSDLCNKNLTSLKGLTSIRPITFLNATHNKTTKIEAKTLPITLTMLNLAYNKISSIAPGALSKELEGLYLGNNNLSIIKKNCLPKNLKYLDLQNNQIETIEDGALPQSLRVVHLNKNKLSSEKIAAIRKQLPKHCYLFAQNQDFQYKYKLHILQFANPRAYLLDALKHFGFKAIAEYTHIRTVAYTSNLDKNLAPLLKWLAELGTVDAVSLHRHDTKYKRVAIYSILNGKIEKKATNCSQSSSSTFNHS